MGKTFLVGVLFGLSICRVNAQSPAFEVASITPCEPGTPEPGAERMGMVQFTFPGGNFKAKATSLKFLLEWSYGILPSQHSDGPSWMENDRYDIVAKAGASASDAQMKRMVRTLLAERFKLKFRVEKKEVPVVIVSLGKTAPRLYPPKEGEQYSIEVKPTMGPDEKVASWRVVATRFSFAQLNETFSRQLERVIVNQTGMDGDYDFTLTFTPDEDRPNPLDAANIIAALRDQLGLAVKSQKAPVDFFVIDSAEKVVAGN